jgi:ribosomal-protein-alanine N-acetyltransferase
MSPVNGFEIRPMTLDDVPAVETIQLSSLPNSAAGWAARDFLFLEAFVAVREGKIEGFLVSRRLDEDEYELLNMAVAHDRRRRGSGKALLEHVLSREPDASWYLEVRASNQAAQALYEGLGFHRSGLRCDYYRSPLEDAIEMSLLR